MDLPATISEGVLIVGDKTYSLLGVKRFKSNLQVLSADIQGETIVCGCNQNRIILIKGSVVNILLASELPPVQRYALNGPQLLETSNYRTQQVNHVKILQDNYFVSQSSKYYNGESYDQVRRIWYLGECIFRWQGFENNAMGKQTWAYYKNIIEKGIDLRGTFQTYANKVSTAINRAREGTVGSPGAAGVPRGGAGGRAPDGASKMRF